MMLLLALLLLLLIGVVVIACAIGVGNLLLFIVISDVITSIAVLIWIFKKIFRSNKKTES